MPIVWRTILVRPETKLALLHRYVQAAMGWHERHLFMFKIDAKEYAIPNHDLDFGIGMRDSRRYTLERLFPKLPATFEYTYDFGDRWEHVIEIEGREEAEYRKQYPICVAAAEECPPEDVGGPPGYRMFLAAMRDADDSPRRRSDEFLAQMATWDLRAVRRGY